MARLLKIILFYFLFTSILFNHAFTQSLNHTVDSIKQLLVSATDTNRVNLLNNVAYEYMVDYPDTATRYANEALVLSKSLDFTDGQITAYNYLGLAQYYSNNYDNALGYYNSAISLARKSGNKLKEAMTNNNIGLVYDDKADYKKALEYYLKGLSLVEKIGNKRLIANITNNVALIYQSQGKYDQALEYQLYSLKLKKEIKYNSRGLANSLHNIGLIYKLKGDYKKSLEYNLKALELRRSMDEKNGIALSLNNIGSVYEAQKQFDKATPYFEEALEIRKKLSDRYGLALAMLNVGFNKCNRNQFDKGTPVINEALHIAYQIGAKDLVSRSYEMYTYAYAQKKDFENAYKYQSLFILVKDSILNSETSKQVNELQAKYDSEKKKSEIALLNKDKELQRIEIKRQTLQKYALVAVVGLMLILIVFIFKSYRDKKRANIKLQLLNDEINQQKDEIEEKNHELSQQNEEIRTQRDEIEAQRDEIEAQRDTVTNQKTQLEKIHKEVTDSIHYAKKIQEAVLPTNNVTRTLLKEHFVLFKPKDVVSGDFYWFSQTDNKLMIAVSDCTGHGVPGGFMSMLGISFLNEIISRNISQAPSEILGEMRRFVISSLQQQSISGNSPVSLGMKDGMDMSFVTIDLETLKMQFSGANNPVYIVRKFIKPEGEKVGSANFPLSGFILEELKADKMPIAIHVNMNDFTHHEIQLSPGDIIYLFSDGYADQFGGEKGRKFMYKQFKELLVSIHTHPMKDQCSILDLTIEKWKNNFQQTEQTDDITVVGIKI